MTQEETIPTSTQPTSNPVADAPAAILSTQEYGQMYLDLSGENQACFDKIIATWPDRFTESVREGNVKALRIFATVCSTGIDKGRGGTIYSYGPNGEFFDSEVAASYKN